MNDVGDRVYERDRLRDPASRPPASSACLRAGIVIDQAGDGVPPSTEEWLRAWTIL